MGLILGPFCPWARSYSSSSTSCMDARGPSEWARLCKSACKRCESSKTSWIIHVQENNTCCCIYFSWHLIIQVPSKPFKKKFLVFFVVKFFQGQQDICPANLQNWNCIVNSTQIKLKNKTLQETLHEAVKTMLYLSKAMLSSSSLCASVVFPSFDRASILFKITSSISLIFFSTPRDSGPPSTVKHKYASPLRFIFIL